ncbi:IclR family transcriptional regulator [Rhodococcus sp. NPDC127530]|uniref:IclR family transcriptional regulator n=1 Tax=unclassified Rhodococcus (in: high G+C Gram-positive bacteria) TaxID=192944 RepID=UPI00362CF464
MLPLRTTRNRPNAYSNSCSNSNGDPRLLTASNARVRPRAAGTRYKYPHYDRYGVSARTACSGHYNLQCPFCSTKQRRVEDGGAMLGTVAKAGRVLDLFTSTNPEWGVCEVADRLEIPKSSAHALLSTLCEIGLTRRSVGGRYRLGWRIAELNRTLVGTTGLLASARPVLHQLADQLHATVELAALRHLKVSILDSVDGAAARNSRTVGPARPSSPHGTALGKVLLAHSEVRVIDAFIGDDRLMQHTPHTITCPTRFRAELKAIRLRGVGCDVEEAHIGLCSVAAPIRDAGGAVHAAISLTVPALSFRRDREVLCRSVQRVAGRISTHALSVDREIGVGAR